MPSEVFVIDFWGKSVSPTYSIVYKSNITEDNIIDIFSGREIVMGAIQQFSTDTNKVLYYAIGEEEKKSLLGIMLGLNEEQELFEKPLREEAELLLQKDRSENFFFEIKISYQNIIQKSIENIEERISGLDKERDENNRSVENLEEEMRRYYNEEKELLAELEKEEETNSIMEKIEAVITEQKQLEELIKTKKNIQRVHKEKSFNFKNKISELQEFYNQISEFTFVQYPEPGEIIIEETEVEELEPTIEATSEISDLMKKLETLSSKQLTSQSESVSYENSTFLESETPTSYNETIESITESTSSEISSVSEMQSEKATISDILIEKIGGIKAAIMEYLFWLKKPRTIAEISRDLETPAEDLREHIEDMVKNGYMCKLTKKNIKEIYLTICPSCPLQSKCVKERAIDWDQILSKNRNV
ncbi:MAG: hypothetical protein ACETWM_18310 [Candidatus Lokiarchaeia archaeon]